MKASVPDILLAAGFGNFETEFQFHSHRKWRFDYAWPEIKLALEIDGGTLGICKGRHVRGTGYARDCEKLNTAVFLGWSVLRYTTQQVDKGLLLADLQTHGGKLKARKGSRWATTNRQYLTMSEYLTTVNNI